MPRGFFSKPASKSWLDAAVRQFPYIDACGNSFIKGQFRIFKFDAERRVLSVHGNDHTRVEPKRDKLMKARVVVWFYIGDFAFFAGRQFL